MKSTPLLKAKSQSRSLLQSNRVRETQHFRRRPNHATNDKTKRIRIKNDISAEIINKIFNNNFIYFNFSSQSTSNFSLSQFAASAPAL